MMRIKVVTTTTITLIMCNRAYENNKLKMSIIPPQKGSLLGQSGVNDQLMVKDTMIKEMKLSPRCHHRRGI
jgi:hypothetical protein